MRSGPCDCLSWVRGPFDGSACCFPCSSLSLGVVEVGGADVGPGADGGVWAGPPEWGDDDGWCDGLGDGLLLVWAVGATPGLAWLDWPCHESATYPPFGTLSAVTPREAYCHVPDLPSDHHSDQ